MMIIPDSFLQSARITEKEVLQELAIVLFAKERLTSGQACRLAQMNRFDFQHLLASRNITIHYDKDELLEDIETLKDLGR